jgi:hypothetical protein
MISNLNDAQNSYNRLIDLFVNGVLYTRKSRMLYPFCIEIDTDSIREDLNQLCIFLKINTGEIHEIRTSEELAKILSGIFKNLSDLILTYKENNSKSYESISVFKEFSNKDYNRDRETQLINKLVKYLSNTTFPLLIKSFYIHGSYSTMDYVKGISDLDTLIIIKNGTLLDYEKLLELHYICYQSLYYFNQIDPLQHHGYIVLTEADLVYYPQNYFPVILFNYSTSVFASSDVKVCLRVNNKERQDIYLQTLKFLKENKPSDFKDIFHFKLYFQVLQLLPIAYLQRKNINVYKRYSFEIFFRYFPESKELFDNCETLRNNWKIPIFKLDYIGELILKVINNPNIILFLNRLFFKNVPKYMDEIFNDEIYERKILPLIERLEGDNI